MTEIEVVIIGAGAAGIGAGLELQAQGVPFVILEAADRVGGRADTDSEGLPVPWDRGCHWLHCAEVNPLVAWADRLGATYLRQEYKDHFEIWQQGRFITPEELREAGAATIAALEAITSSSRRDVSIAEVIPVAGRWAPGVGSILRMMAGDDIEQVSAAWYADYDDTGTNWPVVSGYGKLIAGLSAGLPVRLGVAARGVTQTAKAVTVETSVGKIEARAAIVTASTSVLASGAIAFAPGQARDLLPSIAKLPCGAYEKVALALRGLPAEAEGKLFCMVDPGGGAPAVDFQVMATDPPLMIAHLAGRVAREVAAGGEQAMIAFAKERLTMAFGTAFEKEILAAAVTAWSANPLIQGSYAHALPGAAGLRHEMIARDTGRVLFAGEAFSRNWQATAHGAYRSGRDAALRAAAFAGMEAGGWAAPPAQTR